MTNPRASQLRQPRHHELVPPAPVHVGADLRIGGRGRDCDLPIWIDANGDLRLALPEHSGDVDRIVFHLGEFVRSLPAAIERGPSRVA